MKLFDIRGRTALVTGASSGLGEHFARFLASQGARVIVAARRRDWLEKLARGIGESGGEAIVLCADVSSSEGLAQIEALAAEIDILVNNAGIVRDGPALSLSEQDWDSVMDTNLKAMFALSQVVAKARQQQGSPASIINVASILGLRQAGSVLSYAVSKAGVIQLTKCLALEWARYGIRVNALAPGYVSTELNGDFCETDAGQAMIRRIPQRRLADLEDLDGPLLLLASDAGAYMTGTVVAVDGGHLVSTL